MENSCEYIEKAFEDNRQGVFQLYVGWIAENLKRDKHITKFCTGFGLVPLKKLCNRK
jgi:hypothetical protein